MDPLAVLADHWRIDPAHLVPVSEGGLINSTWLVGSPPRWVLQLVNPIFHPSIHRDIEAVTRRLEASGLITPRLIPTRHNTLWVDGPDGCWRLQSFVPGNTYQHLPSSAAAQSAGELVGRFHAVLDDWSYTFVAPRREVHDTPARMEELEAALADVRGHPLADDVRRVGETILADYRELCRPENLPLRSCHGDLKVANLRFDSAGTAVALIDLDTVGPLPLPVELADAWRSWCNPAGEDDPGQSHFSVELFARSLSGWMSTNGVLTDLERDALVPSIELICLELAARFCADVMSASYFREDRARFPDPGEHNLRRARGQLALARSVRSQRKACEAVVHAAAMVPSADGNHRDRDHR